MEQSAEKFVVFNFIASDTRNPRNARHLKQIWKALLLRC